MKRVWLVNHYAVPPGGTGGTRHYGLARGLRALGWDALIIAASTELNTNKQRLAKGQKERREMLGEVDFVWLRAPSYKGNGMGRLVNMLAFAWRLVAHSNGLPKPDAILGSSPDPFAALAAWLIARIKGVPFLYEIRDLWPQGLIELGRISPKHPLMRVFAWMEKFLARRADRIVTLLPGVKDYLVPLGVDASRIVYIPNGIDTGLFGNVQPAAAHDDFTFMYFGAHGNANGLADLLEAMRLVDDPSIKLRLIGDGPLKEMLVKQGRSFNLTRVKFEAPVGKRDIPALAAEADAFIFHLVDAPVFAKYGISANKLFDFMAAARPVLFACKSWNDPVAEAGAGVTAAADSPAAIAQAMRELAALPLAERQEMGRRGREYVLAHHSFAKLAEKLRDTLNEVLSKRQR